MILFEDLWLGVRNMGHRKKWNDHLPAVARVYQALQDQFLSIPGHRSILKIKSKMTGQLFCRKKPMEALTILTAV